MRQVKCPGCGVAVPWIEASCFRPFCSARCKSGDLGAWANEHYRVATRDDMSEAEELPLTAGFVERLVGP